jgi:aminoglycoside/choline kinase family phosphotransferase
VSPETILPDGVGAGLARPNTAASTIGVLGTSLEENNAFLYIADHLHKKGLPVPQVLAVSDDRMSYLQEDLGDVSLFDHLDDTDALHRTIALLPRLQFEGAEGMDWSRCYPSPAFDAESILFDLHYFKYCFLKATVGEFNEVHLEKDLKRFASAVSAQTSCLRPSGKIVSADTAPALMHRDFQARNIMLHEGNPYLIDFQGARKGPYLYDLASFLWQARAGYSSALRKSLTQTYMDALRAYTDTVVVPEHLYRYALLRILQTLGAYGFRGFVEHKPHFLQSIPPALHNLKELLDEGVAEDYPTLNQLLHTIVNDACGRRGEVCSPDPAPATIDNSQLTIKVFSFSYKHGIPEDESGNGGGYVFDCRAIHNPGRYDEYKQLTGRDEPVRRFLEQDGEILRFMEHVFALADAHVERYIERGFTHLMFSFGCTGGQHRSVYAAESLARHLREKGHQVQLTHKRIVNC